MAFEASRHRIPVALSAILATAVLSWFGNGLNPWWPLMWFAPLPVLLVALRNSGWGAALTAVLACMLGGLSMWHYFHVALHAPPVAWIFVYATASLAFAAAVLLYRALLLRGKPWSALLAFPATLVSFEYLRNLATPHGTAGSFAYTQLHFLPFLQLASITGPWGMSFLLLLFPAAIAIGVRLRHAAPKQALRVVCAGMGVIALVLILGAVRLARTEPGLRVRVGLIASGEPANDTVVDPGAATERLFRDYAAEAETLAAAGAQVIVLPEKIGVLVDPTTTDTDAIFQSLADTSGTTIVAGLVHVASPVKYNQARIYTPHAAVMSYDKHHMLPPFESDLKPGTTLTLLPRSSGAWGVAICKDMDFTGLSRAYGNAGVGLMLDPAWDFAIDRAWHGHIAIMRGVESGFSIAHTAKNGYLTVSDSRGRILAETRSDAAPFSTLIADVPVVHSSTLYLLLGNWFAWLSLVTLGVVVLRLFL